ncbi:MAG TPA: hypothetical protein VG734_27305 [Lacunisphaera sp.]|nr:hypothetical protein [Lacunisphaera sp.]
MRPPPLVGWAASLTLAIASVVLGGCGKAQPSGNEATGRPAKAPEDWVQAENATPAEKAYLEYGRGLVEAIANNAYADFHAQLSTHAKARMSLNQFAPEDDDAKFDLNEKRAEQNVTLPRFLELMQNVEARFGRPVKPLDLHVHTTEAAVLAGTKKEGLEALEVMMAIGNMPALAPADSRKASLRARIRIELSPEQLAEAAKAYQTTPTELLKSEDFQPHLTLKLVLVEEAGKLQVGYFEFLPPSMLD